MPEKPENLEKYIALYQQPKTCSLGPYQTWTLCYNINCHCICKASEVWKEERRNRHCYTIQRAKAFASSDLLTDTCCLHERCRNTICNGRLTRMIVQCSEEWKPIGPACVHQFNTSLDFQNSQSTITLSTIIPYPDSVISLSNWEIDPMFLLKCYDVY